jgi:methylmalonyl-CoA mutase
LTSKVGPPGGPWHFETMSDQDDLALGAEFPAAMREQWQKLVAAVLKGAPAERLTSETHGGLRIAPLYGRAAAVRPVSGRAPGTAWTVMQRVDHPEIGRAHV